MKEQQESKPKKPNILVRLIALLVTAALLLGRPGPGGLPGPAEPGRAGPGGLSTGIWRPARAARAGSLLPRPGAGRPASPYLDSGVLLASDTGARYYSFSGELYAEEVRNLEQPVLTHSSSCGVVYDAGGPGSVPVQRGGGGIPPDPGQRGAALRPG